MDRFDRFTTRNRASLNGASASETMPKAARSKLARSSGDGLKRTFGATIRGLLALFALAATAALVLAVVFGLLAVLIDGLFASSLPLVTIKSIVSVAISLLVWVVLPFPLAAFFSFCLGCGSVRDALRYARHIGLRLYAKMLLVIAATWLAGGAVTLLIALVPLPLVASVLTVVCASILGVAYLYIVFRLFDKDKASASAASATSARAAKAATQVATRALCVLLTIVLIATLIPIQAAYAANPRSIEPAPNTTFERNNQVNEVPAPTPAPAPDESLLREPVADTAAQEPEPTGGIEAYHDKTSRTFEMPDGTYLTRVYTEPLTYTGDDGLEHDIDSTLVETDDGYTNKANSYEVSLPRSGEAIEIQNAGYTLRATPLFGALENAVVKDNAIRYNNIMQGIDLQYTATPTAVKEDITVNHPIENPTFSFALAAAGIRFVATQEAVYGYAEGDLYDNKPVSGAIPVFTLTAPVMTDNSGVSSQDIRLELGDVAGKLVNPAAANELEDILADGRDPDYTTSSVIWPNDACTLTIIPSAQWLAEPERAYPVTIDPTYQLGAGSISYGTIQSLGSTLSAGPNVEHRHGYLYAGLENGTLVGTIDPMTGYPIAYGMTRAFVRIDDLSSYIANIPEGVILSAQLHGYRYAGVGNTYRTVSAKMIASDWLGQAYTWNNRPANYTDLANSQDVSARAWITWDITEAFKAWVRDPSTNRGIMLIPDDESQPGVTFSGPGNVHGGQDLYFDLNWTVPNAVDENKPFDAPNVELRPYTTKDGPTGLQTVTGLTADGEVRPQLEVDYRLALAPTAATPSTSARPEVTVDTGYYPRAEWGRVYPDSTDFEGVIDFTFGYYGYYESNWQSGLFTTFALNSIYNVFAVATDGTTITPEGKSDDFIMYRFTQSDTLPYVAAYYGVSRQQLIKDNRVQDNLAFAGNTLFIRNPTQNATVPYTRPDNLTLDQKRAHIYASMGRNMVSEFDIEPVDMATGNFYFESTDASNSDYTTTFDLTRSYNALAPKTPGAFGLGWTFNYLQTLTGNADGSVAYTRGDGKILVFAKSADGSGAFVSPVGYNLTLEELKGVTPEDTTWTITDANDMIWAFDSYGLLASVTDKQGNATLVGYDASYHLASLTTPSGKTYLLTTNAVGQVTKVIMPNGGVLSYTYEDDCLVAFANADGDTVRYVYDANGLLTEWYDGNNNRMIANEYDSQGRVVQQIDARGGISTLAYTTPIAAAPGTPAGPGTPATPATPETKGTTILTDAEGNVTTYTLDGAGRIVGVEGARTTETRVWDSDNHLAVVTDAVGNATIYTYDAAGNVTRRERADGTYEESTYDQNNNPTQVCDFAGNITINSYDVAGNLTHTKLPDGTTITYTRDVQGRPTTIIDGEGNTTSFSWTGTSSMVSTDGEGNATTYYYDLQGNLVNIVDALGIEHRTIYSKAGKLAGTWLSGSSSPGAGGSGSIQTTNLFDASGNCIARIDGDGYRTDFIYDEQNNLVVATDPTGATMTNTYDLLGNKTSTTTALGTTTYVYDGAGRLISTTDAAGTMTINIYDALGRLASATDALGAVTSYTYDDISGLPIIVNSPKGTESFNYDALGNTVAHTAADGTRTTYVYDAMSRVSEMTSSTGLVSTYSYNSNGKIIRIEDSEGRIQTFTYDKANRLQSYTNAEGYEFGYGYDAAGNLVTEIMPDGETFCYTYDSAGNKISVTAPDGVEEYFAWDKRGNLTAHTDRAGNVTTYLYDARSDLAAIIDALGGVVSYTYDASELLATTTGALSQVSAYSYDSLGRPVSITDPLGHLSQIAYDAAGNTTRATAADGSAVTSSYDTTGRLVSSTDAVGYTVSYAYDGLGRMSGWFDSVGASMDFTYDSAGRLTGEVDALGRQARYSYDRYGNLVKSTDFNGDTTTTTYDKLNRATSVTTNDGRTTAYAYDSIGRLTTNTDADGKVTSYTYDALGNLVATTDVLGKTTTYFYDAMGNLVKTTYADGVSEGGEYDALGRLVKETDGNSNATNYTYDASSRLIAITYADGTTVEAAYDSAGNIAAHKDEEGYVTTYTYDEMGRRTNVTTPRGAKTYWVFDAKGNLEREIDPLSNETVYSYLPNGSLQTRTAPNGLVTSYTYDIAGRMTSIEDSLGLALHLDYDAQGNIATQSDQNGATWSYVYDAMHRITNTSDPLGNATTNTYDRRGNLLNSQLPGGVVYSYTYDALGNVVQGQKPATAPVGFEYDERGRLVATTQGDKLYTSTFDGAGNLTATTDPLAHTTTYTYDQRNRLATTTDAKGATTSLAYTPAGRVAQQTDPLNNVQAFTYDGDGNMVSARDERGNTTTYRYDMAANLIEVTDAMGRFASFDYDAMGNIVKRTTGSAETNYGYDLHDNLTSITSPDGSIERFTYDVNSRLTQKIKPDESVISYDYDALDKLIAKRYSTNLTDVTYAFDTRGQRLSMDDATGTSSYTYDEAGRLATYTNGDKKTLVYAWDEYGRMANVTYPDGRVVSYTYDLADRITEVKDSAQGTVAYEWDAVGNVVSCTRPNGYVTTYAYDVAGQLLELVNRQNDLVLSAFTYTYDATGAIATEDVAQGAAGYHRVFSYDEAGELSGIIESTEDGTEITTYAYDETGNRTATVRGASGHTDTWSYDSTGRLVEAKNGTSGETTRFTYDSNGNLVSKHGAGRDLTYAYDIENRLNAVHDGGELLMAAAYDGDGNRTFCASKILVPVNYRYEGAPVEGLDDDAAGTRPGTAGNGVTSSRGTGVGNPDAPGTGIAQGTMASRDMFWYGFANGIIAFCALVDPAAAPPAQLWLFRTWGNDDSDNTGEADARNAAALDAAGLSDKDKATVLAPPRPATGKEAEADTDADTAVVIPLFYDSFLAVDYELTYYLNDISMQNVQVAASFGGQDELKDIYIYGTERLYKSNASSDKVQTYLYDGRGSVTQRADVSGVQATYAYDAFGKVESGAGGYEVTYAFDGEEYSAVTGLIYLRARYYSPDTAAFLTRDDMLGAPERLNSLNRYSFAESDPVNNHDPSGHTVSSNAYERAMENAGGINEIYNFSVGHTLASVQTQAQAAFNARLGYAQGVDYTNIGAINSISQVSQAQANSYISAGSAAARAVGRTYGCSPGTLTNSVIDAFASQVQAAKETTNQRIAAVKSNKYYQYQQYQAYLAWLAAEQERVAAENARLYNAAYGDVASAYMIGMIASIQQQQATQRINNALNTLYRAAGSLANTSISALASMSATVPTVDWVAVAATVVVAVVLIAVVVASAGTLAPALGIGLMGLGMSYGAAATTGAVIAAVVAGTAATTIGITTISDVSEMVGGRNVVRDDMLGGNQGLYDGIKFASAMAALGMGEVAMANPGLAAGSKPASSGGAMGATPKPASSGGAGGAGTKPSSIAPVPVPKTTAVSSVEAQTTRVGRWMSEAEYEKMVATGKVPMSPDGNRSYVIIPSDQNAFKAASKGSVYVEFDVPSSTIKKGGNEGWGLIPGPGSNYDRFNKYKGLPPILDMPDATNIQLIGRK